MRSEIGHLFSADDERKLSIVACSGYWADKMMQLDLAMGVCPWNVMHGPHGSPTHHTQDPCTGCAAGQPDVLAGSVLGVSVWPLSPTIGVLSSDAGVPFIV